MVLFLCIYNANTLYICDLTFPPLLKIIQPLSQQYVCILFILYGNPITYMLDIFIDPLVSYALFRFFLLIVSLMFQFLNWLLFMNYIDFLNTARILIWFFFITSISLLRILLQYFQNIFLCILKPNYITDF